MLNIVVPMAGAGSRFAKAGYKDPKPLLPIHGVPMIQLVIENLRPKTEHRFIFICQVSHLRDFELEAKLKSWAGPATRVTTVPGLTEGAACTVLTVKELIDSNEPLMIANCDQYIDIKIDDYLAAMDRCELEGLIMTLTSDHPKWSYAAVDPQGHVMNVVEKQVISDHATVGIYNYCHGRDFISAAGEMISKNLRVNNEFYVAPVYNQMIARGQKIGVYDIGREMAGMYGIGTPEDLEVFLKLPISYAATAPLKQAA